MNSRHMKVGLLRDYSTKCKNPDDVSNSDQPDTDAEMETEVSIPESLPIRSVLILWDFPLDGSI